MDWITSLFIEHSAMQAVVVMSLIAALGLTLGKLRIGGISLGVTYVFFVGILAGHIGLSVNEEMLYYAESFGLVLFVYALGLQVGPGFFSTFRKGGVTLNVLSIAVVAIGTIMCIAFSHFSSVSLADMIGVLCGATTNTPALAAAQQTLTQMGIDDTSATLGCAVTYPLGVVGVILAMVVLSKIVYFASPKKTQKPDKKNHTIITSFRVHNPALYGKEIKDIAQLSPKKFVISRVWRDKKLLIPSSTMVLEEHDRILLATKESAVDALTILFGEHETDDWNREDIDWNALDSELVSQRIVITRSKLNGKKLGQLKLRNLYGINISRIYRGDVELLATSELVLQMGDRLTVVGRREALKQVENVLGNRVKHLNEPNLFAIFIGLVLGLALGAVPIPISEMTTPVRLGLAGGPIIVGILIGTFGPRLHMLIYVTRSANLLMQKMGLSLYLACLGLSSGAHFMDTMMRGQGMYWIAIGFALTVVPVLIVGLIATQWTRIDFSTTCGMLCGAMANPMALKYASDNAPDDQPAVAYAAVYPLAMLLRVMIAQLVLMLFLT